MTNLLPLERFRRHTLVQLVARSVELFGQELRSYGKLAAVLMVPTALLSVWLLHDASHALSNLYEPMEQQQNSTNNAYNLQEAFEELEAKLFNGTVFLVVMILVLIAIVVKAAMIRTTVQAFLPSTPATTFINLRHGTSRLPHILCYSLYFALGYLVYTIVVAMVTAMLIGAATLLLRSNSMGVHLLYLLLQIVNVFMSYYITLILVFCMPIMVVERASAWQSLKRAWQMAAGHRGMILCAQLLLLVAIMLVFVLEMVLVADVTSLLIVQALTAILFWMPLGNILMTLLSLNVRIDKEGLNAQLLASELTKADIALGIIDKKDSAAAAAGAYQPVAVNDKEAGPEISMMV